MSCKLEPAIWPRNNGQRIPCFDRCQLIVARMSNIKEVRIKQRLYVFVNLFRSMASMLDDSVAVVVVVRTTASHVTMRKSTHGFLFLSHDEYGAPFWRPFRRISAKTWNKDNETKFPKSIALSGKVKECAAILKHQRNIKQYEYLTAQCCIPFQQKIWPQLQRGPAASCECPYQHNWLETHQSHHLQVVPKGAALRQRPAEGFRMESN